MSVSGDSAEQVVRLSLEGFEVLAKLTGNGAKNMGIMLLAIIEKQKKIKGKTNIDNMLRTGKPLRIFSIKKEDLKEFHKNANSYGILYSVLVNKKNKNLDGTVDILVSDDVAPRVNRLVERFKLLSVDPTKFQTEVEKRDKSQKDKGIQEKTKEELFQDVLVQKPIQKENQQNENFNSAMTAKSPQSEHFLNKAEGVAKTSNNKKSVRKELKEIREDIRKEAAINEKSKEKNIKETEISKSKASNIKDTR